MLLKAKTLLLSVPLTSLYIQAINGVFWQGCAKKLYYLNRNNSGNNCCCTSRYLSCYVKYNIWDKLISPSFSLCFVSDQPSVFYPYGGQPTGMLCSCFLFRYCHDLLLWIQLYSHQWLTSMEASQLGCFTCLYFFCFVFFVNVLLTHCQFYMWFVMNLVLYINIYIYIYIYIYIFVMLHHND